jgi:hypothetical protein
MSIRNLVVFAVVFCTVAAEHDHSLHIDAKFVHGEALRVAWLSREEVQGNLKEYIETLRHLHGIYDNLILNPPEHQQNEDLT